MIILGYMHNDKRKCFFMQNLLVAATFSLGNELIFSQIEGGLHLDFQHGTSFPRRRTNVPSLTALCEIISPKT